ncbi:hypothetical protein [Williamsia sp. CHRR-6]|uniref:hypothetical protein n=1 Tax=Williamsia sp. CHRR-6 TaxID=2835871 RepID=UPI001BDB35AD|nr:hypothetical protein [Williamsia sp. CHRR-6]MBT0567323.1 hypothetical protein [Williamsia sp. CHRR-6]
MTPTRITLAVARMLIGLGAWLAPDLTVRVFGLDPERSNRFVGRLFGAREFALAAALLAAPGKAVATVAAVGAVVDAVDAVAGFDETRRGNLGGRAIALGPVGAMGFAALGALVYRESSRPIAS